MEEHDINDRYLSNLQTIFNIRTLTPEDDEEDGEQVTKYQLESDSLVDEWEKWIRETGIFEEFSLTKISETRFDARGRFNGSDIDFIIFFDKDELERYNLQPESLEFGIGFLDSLHLRDHDHVFAWYEPFEDDFEERFRRHINSYQQTIAAGFADEVSVEGYKIKIQNSIQNYLKDSGYSIRREVGDAVPVAPNFGINTGQSDFAAVKTDLDEQVVLCRCDKKDTWHIHRFMQGTIVSAEDDDDIEHLLDEIQNKIRAYDKIKTYSESINRFSTGLSVFSTIVATFILAQNLSSFRQLLSTTFGVSVPDISLAVNITAVIFILVIFFVISFPYLYQFAVFDWEIQQSNE
ncbi:hypothetical protein [Halorhabdus sp. CUG00001]|uniref:hypothetical protein n=1 Tax=Halorhabdus sp. CUG00001 TaxID=2600297 RepID=UPI00131E4093|nr:hypothetical protein [Halorhabdus sp. CUG00001]